MFKTTLIVKHNEDALFNEELEKFEAAAEDLFLKNMILFSLSLNYQKKIQKRRIIWNKYEMIK